MENGLLELDAQVPTLDVQPDLDDVVYEMTTSEPLVSFVDADLEAPRARSLDPDALDPAIFAGLMAL